MESNVADRLAIQDVQVRYATALDSRDWPLLSTCFLADAQVHYASSPVLEGFEATRAFCDRALSPYRITQHLLGNHVAAIDGDTAMASCTLQAIHVTPGDTEIFTFFGTYSDTLVRTAEGWRIATRTLTPTMVETRRVAAPSAAGAAVE